eukprot:TRINITY_DN3496_c0_g1_i1.p1 TRINITY_DN3496_c0_g1~~TRINITY_DN3496_c0_g1_i1.p1  ORF type:complete len:124 (-),score=0.52 TRINITY_DN3496_c0_g1_i1:130-501(-)
MLLCAVRCLMGRGNRESKRHTQGHTTPSCNTDNVRSKSRYCDTVINQHIAIRQLHTEPLTPIRSPTAARTGWTQREGGRIATVKKNESTCCKRERSQRIRSTKRKKKKKKKKPINASTYNNEL